MERLGMALGLALTVLALSGCAEAPEKGDEIAFMSRSGNEGLRVPAVEISVLEQEAAAGSAEAAMRLSLHYDFVVQDFQQGLFWSSVAAQNGHPIGMYNYALVLALMPDEFSRRRARFWLKKVVDLGREPLSKDAAEKLKRLGEPVE